MTKDIDKLKKKLKADLDILKKVSRDKKVHKIAAAAIATALAVGAAVAIKKHHKKKKTTKKTTKRKSTKKTARKKPVRKKTTRKKRICGPAPRSSAMP